MQYEGNAALRGPDTPKATTAIWFANENSRLIKALNEAVDGLAQKVSPVLPRAETAGSSGGQDRAPSMAATSELANDLRDQNDELSSLIRRVNNLAASIDL